MGSGCRVIGVIGVTAAYCPVQENGALGDRLLANQTISGNKGWGSDNSRHPTLRVTRI
jgi:hypothetical protein